MFKVLAMCAGVLVGVASAIVGPMAQAQDEVAAIPPIVCDTADRMVEAVGIRNKSPSAHPLEAWSQAINAINTARGPTKCFLVPPSMEEINGLGPAVSSVVIKNTTFQIRSARIVLPPEWAAGQPFVQGYVLVLVAQRT